MTNPKLEGWMAEKPDYSRVYQCIFCGLTGTTLSWLSYHARREHPMPAVSCGKCGRYVECYHGAKKADGRRWHRKCWQDFLTAKR